MHGFQMSMVFVRDRCLTRKSLTFHPTLTIVLASLKNELCGFPACLVVREHLHTVFNRSRNLHTSPDAAELELNRQSKDEPHPCVSESPLRSILGSGFG